MTWTSEGDLASTAPASGDELTRSTWAEAGLAVTVAVAASTTTVPRRIAVQAAILLSGSGISGRSRCSMCRPGDAADP